MKKAITLLVFLFMIGPTLQAQNTICCVKIGSQCYAIDSTVKVKKADLLRWNGLVIDCNGSAVNANSYEWAISLKKENAIYTDVIPAKNLKPKITFAELVNKMQSGDFVFIEKIKAGKGHPTRLVLQVQ